LRRVAGGRRLSRRPRRDRVFRRLAWERGSAFGPPPLHTKRSMFLALLAELGLREDQAVYLDDTGT
jgi:hypothetical protein